MEHLITQHLSSGGARIYRLPMRVFPAMIGYAHLVIADDYYALVDVGSGLGNSNADLVDAFAHLRRAWGESIDWNDIQRIVITHAHIDHHGGLNEVRRRSDAPIAVHELDRRVLEHYEERLILTSSRINRFLRTSGVNDSTRADLIQRYREGKDVFRSLPVQDVVEDGDLLDGRFHIYHVPGHCPGQICLRIDDILLSADHILPDVTLFLAPESLNAATGLGHFLQSLRSIAAVPGLRLSLGGHGAPVETIGAAIADIERRQHQRIARVRSACSEPHTLAELCGTMYPKAHHYDYLLALQKVGAYVEFLDQRGYLAIENLEEVAVNEHAAPRYRAVET